MASRPTAEPGTAPADAAGEWRARRVGLALAACAAVGFSLKAVFIKSAYRHGVDAETLLALRMLYSLPLFLLMGLAGARAAQPIALDDWLALGLLGFAGYYGASYFDFLGLNYISAGLERLILFTYPTMVVMYAAWRQRRWPARGTVMALALSYGGVLLAVADDVRIGGGAGVWKGCLLVLASAVFYAWYLLRAAPVLMRIGALRVAAWATTFACLMVLLQFVLMRPLRLLYSQPGIVQVDAVVMAVFSTALPVWMVAEAVSRIGPGRTAIVGLLGPAVTLLLAWIVLGEAPGWLQLAGAALVVTGVYRISDARAAT
jgi:drug/metabolite transporter (DMT)-like permease